MDFFGRVNANSHLVTPNLWHRNDNTVADVDTFRQLSG
jgi:hypothetical protein